MALRHVFIILTLLCDFMALHGEAAERLLLVTGCARSGTGYIAKVLQKCGLDVGHERLGAEGISSWVMAVESIFSPWGPPRHNLKFKHIFHQVRDPLKVISSTYMTEGPQSWAYIIQHIPQIKWNDSFVVKSAKYWYYWNLKAAECAEWTYRVEDLEQVWEEFEKRLGKKLDRSAFSEIAKNYNRRDLKPLSRESNLLLEDFTWKDLKEELDPQLYENLRSLAKKYGYAVVDPR